MTIFHVIKYLPKSARDINGILALPTEIYTEWIKRLAIQNPPQGDIDPDSSEYGRRITTEESFQILKEVLSDYDDL